MSAKCCKKKFLNFWPVANAFTTDILNSNNVFLNLVDILKKMILMKPVNRYYYHSNCELIKCYVIIPECVSVCLDNFHLRLIFFKYYRYTIRVCYQSLRLHLIHFRKCKTFITLVKLGNDSMFVFKFDFMKLGTSIVSSIQSSIYFLAFYHKFYIICYKFFFYF